MATKLKTIPDGMRVKTINGQNFLVKQKRTHKRYKMSKAQRMKIAANARKLKLPLLTMAAVGAPLGMAINRAGGFGRVFTPNGFRLFSGSLLGSYTGYDPSSSDKFAFMRMTTGLFPLLALALVNKSGLLKPINQKFARARIPIRLS